MEACPCSLMDMGTFGVRPYFYHSRSYLSAWCTSSMPSNCKLELLPFFALRTKSFAVYINGQQDSLNHKIYKCNRDIPKLTFHFITDLALISSHLISSWSHSMNDMVCHRSLLNYSPLITITCSSSRVCFAIDPVTFQIQSSVCSGITLPPKCLGFRVPFLALFCPFSGLFPIFICLSRGL